MKNLPEIRLRETTQNNQEINNVNLKTLNKIRKHKIGGVPDFIQSSFFPKCPKCNEEMLSYGQLDSVDGEMILGDDGMIYVFVCKHCLKTKSFCQYH